MKIIWLGHSCFKLEKNGYCVVIDPYDEGSVPGLKPLREKADVVLCSHEHGDHHGERCVELIKSGAENPFTVEVLESYHDEVHGAKRGLNKIFLISDGETRVAHLGDLGCDPAADQKEKLKGVDVLLIPVGGHFTIDGKQAAELVRALNPRIAIPMHYRDDAGKIGYDVIGTVSGFTEALEDVMVVPASELDSAYELSSQVVVLQPQNAEEER